jgi:hypothetical protein
MSFDPILKLDRFIISETAKAQEVVRKAGLKLD